MLAGSPFFDAFVLVLAAAMAWEWARLCRGGRFDAAGWAIAAAAMASVVLASAGQFGLAVLCALAASAVVAIIVRAVPSATDRFWIAVAPVAVALPCIAVLWLRNGAESGVFALFWLVGVVWGTDIGAYFTGRALGGPLLAPRISPKKTWSGLCGGVVCAAAWSLVFGLWSVVLPLWWITLFGAGLAVLAQAGDLAESALKRRYGAKDASRLIPGHGGVLDRLDGMLPTAPAVAALMMVMKGGNGGWP